MYIQITRRKSYSSLKEFEVDRAKTIINFMRQIYLSEHPFDELDAIAQTLTESTDVVSLLYPKSDELRKAVEVLINFDNMLALGADNYKRFNSHTLALTNQQTALITEKKKAVCKVFDHLQLTRTPSDNTLKLLTATESKEQRQSAQIERRKHYHIISIDYYGISRKNQLYLVTIEGGKIICGRNGNVYYLCKDGDKQRFNSERTDEHGELIITTGGRGLHARTFAVADLIAMCFCPWYNERVII